MRTLALAGSLLFLVATPISPAVSSSGDATVAVAAGTASVRQCFGRVPTIVGSAGPDRIRGTRRDDVIDARRGDDVVVGLGGSDRVCTGAGDDVARARRGFAVDMDGEAGDDLLVVRDARFLRGGFGADRLVVRVGFAFASGGPGPDLLRAGRRAQERGPDEGPCMMYLGSPRRVSVDLSTGQARGEGRDRLRGVRCVVGSRFADVLAGSVRDDNLEGAGGNDEILSRDGRDIVRGGSGADLLELGVGSDFADGNQGADRMFGQAGSDFMLGWEHGDFMSGGTGADSVHAGVVCDLASSFGNGTIDSAPNTVLGGPGNDYVTGDLGDDRVDGGLGSDRGAGGAAGTGVDVVTSVERTTDC